MSSILREQNAVKEISVKEIVEKLGAEDNGHGHWSARCPKCGEEKLSLLELGSSVVMHCFGGCTIESVCSAIGMQVSQLYQKEMPPELSIMLLCDSVNRDIADEMWIILEGLK